MSMIYKVSYVVLGGSYPGGIRNEQHLPRVGSTVKIGPRVFHITEVHEMMAPRDGFQFVQATVAPVDQLEHADEDYW
ncbi:MAG: hypothetical protein EA396_08885 [Anaerolineaceae bacterium]|nr:MAG: hypothetical protein EA396_08885 [Anaerolineaceae bacterium]